MADHPKIQLLIGLGLDTLKNHLGKAASMVDSGVGKMKDKLKQLQIPSISGSNLSSSMKSVSAKVNSWVSAISSKITGSKIEAPEVGTSLLEKSIGKIKMLVATIGVITAVGAGVGYSINQGMEGIKNKTSFEVLGGQEKGNKLYGDITKFAQDSIFGNELYKDAQTMLAFGVSIDKVMPRLKMLGDISMGDKERLQSLTLAFSQITSAGRLQGQDLLQLVNAGFNPLQVISEKTGKSMGQLKDIMEKGGISADMVTKAFESATSEGGKFYQMTEKIANTPAGKWEALKGQIQGVALQFGTSLLPSVGSLLTLAAPMVDHFGQILQGLTPYINDIVKHVIDMLPAFQRTFAPLAGILQGIPFKQLVQDVMSLVGTIGSGLVPVVQELIPVFGTIISALSDVRHFIMETAGNLFKSLAPALAQVAHILSALSPVLQLAGTLFKWLVGIVAWAADKLLWILKPILTFIGWVAEAIGNMMNTIADAIGSKTPEIQNTVQSALSSQGILTAAADGGKNAGTAFADAFNYSLKDLINDIPGKADAMDSWKLAGKKLGEVVVTAKRNEGPDIGNLFGNPQDVVNNAKEYLSAVGHKQGREAFDKAVETTTPLLKAMERAGTHYVADFLKIAQSTRDDLRAEAQGLTPKKVNGKGEKSDTSSFSGLTSPDKITGQAHAAKTTNINIGAFIKGDVVTQNKMIQNMSSDELQRFLLDTYRKLILSADTAY